MAARNAKKHTTTGPGRLSAEATAGIPDRLLDAAFTLFIGRGYAETSMEMIARQAGASTKTIYTRYANKSEILEAVVRRNVERAVVAHVTAIGLDSKGIEPRAFLLALGTQIAGASDKETAGLTRLTFADAHRFPVLRRLYVEVTGRGIAAIKRALEEWREDGLIDELDDVEKTASLCFGMMTDGPRIRAILGDPMSRTEMQAHVTVAVDLFLRGCGAGKARAAPKARRK